MNSTRNTRRLCALGGTLAISLTLVSFMSGCSGDNDRVPTKDEVKAADTKRQSYIDTLNIPEDQKAAMKAHLGGPPVASPQEAAKEKAGGAAVDRK